MPAWRVSGNDFVHRCGVPTKSLLPKNQIWNGGALPFGRANSCRGWEPGSQDISLSKSSLASSGGPVAEVGELGHGKKLLHVVEAWLREERDTQRLEALQDPAAKQRRPGAVAASKPVMPSKHMAFFR